MYSIDAAMDGMGGGGAQPQSPVLRVYEPIKTGCAQQRRLAWSKPTISLGLWKREARKRGIMWLSWRRGVGKGKSGGIKLYNIHGMWGACIIQKHGRV
jgi:hypothetical protein